MGRFGVVVKTAQDLSRVLPMSTGFGGLGTRVEFARGIRHLNAHRPARVVHATRQVGRLGQWCPPAFCPVGFCPVFPTGYYCPPAGWYCPPVSGFCPPVSGFCPPVSCPPISVLSAACPPQATLDAGGNQHLPNGDVLYADGSAYDASARTYTLPDGTVLNPATNTVSYATGQTTTADVIGIIRSTTAAVAASGQLALQVRNSLAAAGVVTPTVTTSGAPVYGWINSQQYRLRDGTVITPSPVTSPTGGAYYVNPATGQIVPSPVRPRFGGLFGGGGGTFLIVGLVALMALRR